MIKQALIVKEMAQIVAASTAFKHWLMLIPIKAVASKVIVSTVKNYYLTKARQLKNDITAWKHQHPNTVKILHDANTLYLMLMILDAADVLIQ